MNNSRTVQHTDKNHSFCCPNAYDLAVRDEMDIEYKSTIYTHIYKSGINNSRTIQYNGK